MKGVSADTALFPRGEGGCAGWDARDGEGGAGVAECTERNEVVSIEGKGLALKSPASWSLAHEEGSEEDGEGEREGEGGGSGSGRFREA